MAKRAISKEPGEERRFEVLLEEIRGQLRLLCEAQAASVKRDEALDAKIEKICAELMKGIRGIKEILLIHDKRISAVEHI